MPVEFYVSLPTQDTDSEATRVGDPGTSTGEAIDWDCLTVIVAYSSKDKSEGGYDSESKKMVYWDTFTREEFESTSPVYHSSTTLTPVSGADGTDSGLRMFEMPLPLGNVRVYGITYSSPSLAANASIASNLVDVEARLKALPKDGADHNSDIVGWQIPNSYASTDNTVSTIDVAKFLSVATGVAYNYKDADNPTIDLTIMKDNRLEMRQYWSMTCRRLAAKLDIQWDAQQAYDNQKKQYVDVKVDGFKYKGYAAATDDPGYGLMFPFEVLHPDGFTPIGGATEFRNTSEISRRNGRVYHYIFPDGSSSPRIDFSISTKEQNKDWMPRTFSFLFEKVAPIQPSTWYKINAKVKGNTQESTEVVIDKFNTGS